MNQKFDINEFDSYIKNLKLSNGETYAYIDFNQDKTETIILIHGNLVSSYWFYPLFQFLINSDFRIIALDLRGFGRSSYNNKCEKIKDWADDVADFSKQLNLSQSIFVGYSFGGGVVQELAINYPELVKKIVLLASVHIGGYPILNDGKRATTYEEVLQNSVIQMTNDIIQKKDFDAMYKVALGALCNGKYKFNLNKQEDKRAVEEMLLQKCYYDVIYSLTCYDISSQGTGQYQQINQQILIIHGDKDIIVVPNLAQNNFESFGDKQAKLQILQGVSHLITFDEPQQVSQTLLDFAKQN
ncbi:hypothetical protein PPERSA_04292 [Pseudocohnilembus persalinus]|uniref:AB hydrolase-1 domain-containing protein n=1 Tax=Pseudocohnilembus persalinus TaxID=266149 RepID=A0A0V0QP16_PSEPJ|nr:hypothetical protein PPERSA_04292 [Pseudocohnilembus persalinus]|eukprot:KRX03784.1 hypothetical protein PPERSA_04292 [Pseudocohnilembus persalinus]